MNEPLKVSNDEERARQLWEELMNKLKESEEFWIELSFLFSNPFIREKLSPKVQNLFRTQNTRGKDFYWFMEALSNQRERNFDSLLLPKEEEEEEEEEEKEEEEEFLTELSQTTISIYDGKGGGLNAG